MRRSYISFALLLMFVVLPVGAQHRRPCIRNIPTDKAGTRATLRYPSKDWDANKTYRQAVVLITFADADFSMADPNTFYDRMFNEPGFNEGYGQGCVADYFRDQSGGLFNLKFDVYGPFKVSDEAKGGSYNDHPMRDALSQLNATTTTDFKIYDWDGDGEVEQIIFVAASYCGNQMKGQGYIWPATGYAIFNAPGGLGLGMYSISCELWRDATSCGIGTICHEFVHCLGLPDLYPVGGTYYSAIDEWDLMDGGNYTNKGWCPPNFSALEKMLLGWASPIELTSPTTITGMKPVSEGGETYLIRNSGYDDEFYLLENRRQTKWDYCIPGQGLAIFHADYNQDKWTSNQVNNVDGHYRYDLFHADGKAYIDWDPKNDGKDDGKYTMEPWARNRYLSTSVYPFTNPETLFINEGLTDGTSPAATLYYANADGAKFMQKAITNIQVASDGSISFDFMQVPSGINDLVPTRSEDEGAWFDLQGRKLLGKPTHKGVFIHNGRKIVF